MQRYTIDGWEGDNLHLTDENGKHLMLTKCQFVNIVESTQAPVADDNVITYDITFNLPFTKE